jgi:hypothetical protein
MSTSEPTVKKQKMLLALLAAAGVCISVCVSLYVLWLYYQSDAAAVLPAQPWHISGTVLDIGTNLLTNVTVTATGEIRVTFLNQLLGTKVQDFQISTATDAKGRFDLQVKSFLFDMVFSKAGYVDKKFNFAYRSKHPVPTNQVLVIHLE